MRIPRWLQRLGRGVGVNVPDSREKTNRGDRKMGGYGRPIITGAAQGAAAGGVLGAGYGAYSHHGERKERRRGRKGKGSSPEAQYRFAKKANKRYEKDIARFMKKYGGEKFKQFPALSKGQNKILDQILGLSGKQLGKKPGKVEKLGRLEQSPLFQQGQSYLQNLLSGDSEAYNNFKAPMQREFREQVLPDILARYGGTSPENSSALQNELSRSGVDFGERLARLRSGLQSEAIPQALQYAGAPLSYQQQRIQNSLFQNQQGFENARNLAGLGLGTNPYHSVFRSASPPIQPAGFSPQQPQPSAFQSFAGGAAPGIGQGLGQGLASGIGSFFNGSGSGLSSATSAAAPAAAARSAPFGYTNQLGGKQFV